MYAMKKITTNTHSENKIHYKNQVTNAQFT